METEDTKYVVQIMLKHPSARTITLMNLTPCHVKQWFEQGFIYTETRHPTSGNIIVSEHINLNDVHSVVASLMR